MLIICSIALLVMVVILANRFAGMQVAISDSQGTIRELREEQHHIGAKLAEREHPALIESFAVSRGMVLAGTTLYVSVDEPNIAGR